MGGGPNYLGMLVEMCEIPGNKMSTRVQMWWDQRNRDIESAKIAEQKREAALAKLTPEERAALQLEYPWR